ENVSVPKRNCRTSTISPAGVRATTLTQSFARTTTKSRSAGRCGCRYRMLINSSTRVCATDFSASFSQRAGPDFFSPLMMKSDGLRPSPELAERSPRSLRWQPTKMPPSRGGEEASKSFSREGLFLRQLDLIAGGQLVPVHARVHRLEIGERNAIRPRD